MSLRVAVYNDSGGMISEGQILRQTGILRPQQLPAIALASASSSLTAAIFGVADQDIANNTTGVAVVSGVYYPFDTSSYSIGDLVYLSDTAGAISPTAGTNEAIIGVVVSIGTSGCVLLREIIDVFKTC